MARSETEEMSRSEPSSQLKLPGFAIVMLVLAAFLIPFMGGNITDAAQTLEPGYVPTVRSLFRGSELATLQHAFLALLIGSAFAFLVIKRKIVQVPHMWISAPLTGLLLLLLASVFVSSYRWVSQVALAEWIAYGLATIAAVAGLGRKNGPVSVLVALSAGTGLMGLMGVLEYLNEKNAGNPSWRIFAGWNNPNAAAGMLAIGCLVSLGLLASAISTTKECQPPPLG
jgi:hypothetical protein